VAKRKYDSSRRQAQAAATRRDILDAATRLFIEDGYVATTMEAIADEAEVSLKTVYLAFSAKGGLLRAVWDLALKGDTDDAPVADRPWYQEVLDEPDPERTLRLLAHQTRLVRTRIGPLLPVLRASATVDADGAALWKLLHDDFHENQRVIVESIDQVGGLRPGLDVDRAADILWTLNNPDVWLLLVVERGWDPEAFEAWFLEVTMAQLLG
jgi:AcrR family transcriptional regulator